MGPPTKIYYKYIHSIASLHTLGTGAGQATAGDHAGHVAGGMTLEVMAIPDTPVLTLTRRAHPDLDVDVSWTEPDDSNSPILPYDLRYRPVLGTIWIDVANLTSRTYTVDITLPSTNYEFQVRATNAIGDSNWTSSVTYLSSNTNAPSLPLNFQISALRHNEVDFTWLAPDDPVGTPPITEYNIRVRANGTNEAWQTHSFPPVLFRTFVGLDSGVEYEFQILATNA